MAKQGDLFNLKTIQRLCDDVKITSKQKQAAKEWLDLLDSGKLGDEKSNYPKFMQIILQDILGYPIKELGFETDNVEFQFENSKGKKVLCFEAKGTSTKDLFAPQHRAKKEHETPIKQTWDYMGSIGLDYGICTNYKDYVLITKQFGYSKYHYFDFESITRNEERLKEFVGIFSKERIIEKGFVEKLHKESVIEEREFTKEFYKLYHETRLMMIKAFQEKDKVSKGEAIYYTQLFLNRLIFIFFVEDRGFIPDKQLFSNRILHLLESGQFTEHSRKTYDDIKELFIAFDKGSRVLGVHGFNGSLFNGIFPEKVYFSDIKEDQFFTDVKQYSKLSKTTKLNEKASQIIKKNPDLNPIISNLLIMDSFDFNTEVNVNILGHIFEQSISDLEELKQEGVSRRKKEGVFYTPEYITDHICRNTIIPYLSKSGTNSLDELIEEYEDNLEELEKKFREIKILDPACGSGAFLVKAIDILLEIHKEIQDRKEIQRYSNEQLQITQDWDENKEIRAIIENNIYGVDVNSESIDITKLSLFLRLASSERKLIGLSQNIKTGNSLIDDKSIDSRAFVWRNEFPEILGELIEDKGFDIIIGNPPYIKNQYLEYAHTDWFKKHKETAHGRIDASGIFIELAKNLLKENGLVSYIISNQFLISEYGRKTRKFLLDKFRILQIIDFADLQVFADASTYVGIFVLKNSTPSDFDYLRIRKNDFGKKIDLSKVTKIDLNSLNEEPWILEDQQLIEKLKKNKKLKEIGGYVAGIVTGNDDVFLFDDKKLKNTTLEKEVLHPILEGTDPNRYMPIKPKLFLIYPYKLQNGKTILIDENEFSKKYPHTYEYLKNNKDKLSTRKDSRQNFGGEKWYGLVRFGLLENYGRERIVSSGEVKEHAFTLDKTKSAHLYARVISIRVDDTQYDIHYVLGLLNSKVVQFYYQHSAPKKQHGYFSLTSSFVNNIPLSLGSEALQTKIISNVKEILVLNRSFDDKWTEFLDLLEINYNLKVNNKIKKFYELEFSELINEFNKQKINLTLETQAEIRNYFNSIVDKINNIRKQVKLKEKEIDESVYNVYNLNEKEIDEIKDFFKR